MVINLLAWRLVCLLDYLSTCLPTRLLATCQDLFYQKFEFYSTDSAIFLWNDGQEKKKKEEKVKISKIKKIFRLSGKIKIKKLFQLFKICGRSGR